MSSEELHLIYREMNYQSQLLRFMAGNMMVDLATNPGVSERHTDYLNAILKDIDERRKEK